MRVTEVRLKLINLHDNPRLLATCSIVLDGCFVVHDLKVIDGRNVTFVSMPQRRLTDRCYNCGVSNPLTSIYCNKCGSCLERDPVGIRDASIDLVHPVTAECRDMVEEAVLSAYDREVERINRLVEKT